MKKILKTASIALVSVIAASASAEDVNKRFYVGGSVGYSKPLKNNFEDKDSKTLFHLKKSNMFTVNLGYKITPDIAVEFSYDYKPKYPVKIELHKNNGGDIANTQATNRIFMVNFVYDLKEYAGFTPFFTIGAGLAQVEVKQTAIPYEVIPSLMGEKLRTMKHKSNCFAWQVGLGVAKHVTEDLSVNIAAKMQVAHNIKLKTRQFDRINTATNFVRAGAALRAPTSADVAYTNGAIKKTLGVGEFTVGFNYSLPF
jgi:opacity protein-like surface antigen